MAVVSFVRLCILGLLLGAPAQSARVQQNIAKDKLKYDHAQGPVDRAKALGKLGRDEYVAARQAIDAGKINDAFELLKNYNDQVASTHEALLKTGVDPEKHSNGFRQLQISARERARELKELAERVAFRQREPFSALQKDLDEFNQKLILELFPRQPGNKHGPKNPQGANR